MRVGKTVLASAAAGLLCLLVTTASVSQDEDNRKYVMLKTAFEESEALPIKSLLPPERKVGYFGECFSAEPILDGKGEPILDGKTEWENYISVRLDRGENFFSEDVFLNIDNDQRCIDADGDHVFQCKDKRDIPSFYKAVQRGGRTYLLRKIDLSIIEDVYCWYTIK